MNSEFLNEMLHGLENGTDFPVNQTEFYGNLTKCREVNNVASLDRCTFVRTTADCKSSIGYLEYTQYMYCLFGPEGVTSVVSLSVFWLLILFAGLGITANDFLCPSLFIISKSLRMSQNVAGVTLLAFGNGSPDIFSAIAGIQQGKTEMVIGGLIGGGIFVTTVVAGSIFLTQDFVMMKRPFLRDVTFYMGASVWAFYLFYSGAIYIYHAIGFVCLYLLYIVVVVVSRLIHQKSLKNSEKAQEAADAERGLKIKVSREDEDDSPETFGIVLTSYFKYHWDEDRRRTSEDLYAYDNSVFSISLPGIAEDAIPPPGYDEIGSKEDDDDSKHCNNNGYGSIDDAKCEKVIVPPDVSQWADFAEKLCPLNIKEWSKQVWWERALDIFKSPVMFILLLTTPVVDYKSPRNNWCRILNSLHCVTGPLFITLATGYPFYMIGGKLPLLAIVFLIFLPAAIIIYVTTTTNGIPRFHTAYAYLGFGVAVVWIYCIANEIVVLLQAVGLVFNLSDSILGLTILAWGNCLLDFLSNLAVARKGFPRMGIAACFGAPFLTLLLGVGVPCTIQLIGQISGGPGMQLVFSRLTKILFGTLAASLLSSVITMAILRFRVRRQYGYFLICLYVVFLIVSVLAESGVF